MEQARRARHDQRAWPSPDFDARVQAALSPLRSNRWGARIWRAICKAVKA